jgi:hypothetical protein
MSNAAWRVCFHLAMSNHSRTVPPSHSLTFLHTATHACVPLASYTYYPPSLHLYLTLTHTHTTSTLFSMPNLNYTRNSKWRAERIGCSAGDLALMSPPLALSYPLLTPNLSSHLPLTTRTSLIFLKNIITHLNYLVRERKIFFHKHYFIDNMH